MDFVTPQTMFVFFFFAINVYGNTRYSKTGIPDQTEGIYTLFQTKMAKSIPYFRLEMLENDTLWGDTYLYGFSSLSAFTFRAGMRDTNYLTAVRWKLRSITHWLCGCSFFYWLSILPNTASGKPNLVETRIFLGKTQKISLENICSALLGSPAVSWSRGEAEGRQIPWPPLCITTRTKSTNQASRQKKFL